MMPAAERERDSDPRQEMLDLAEQAVRALLACGCEVHLRARLARLLPEPPAPLPAPAEDQRRALALAGVLAVLRRTNSTEAAAARAFITAELDAVRARRTP